MEINFIRINNLNHYVGLILVTFVFNKLNGKVLKRSQENKFALKSFLVYSLYENRFYFNKLDMH